MKQKQNTQHTENDFKRDGDSGCVGDLSAAYSTINHPDLSATVFAMINDNHLVVKPKDCFVFFFKSRAGQ